MNERTSGGESPGPGLPRSRDPEGGQHDGGREELQSPPPDRPASVRETMQRSLRYNTGPARRAPARRRKPADPRGLAPSPARELSTGPAAEVPSREVEIGNGIWRVMLRGSSEVGFGSASGPRLLSVGLESPGDAPNPEGTHYLAARDLEDADEDVLRNLVISAMHAPRESASPRPARRSRGRRCPQR